MDFLIISDDLFQELATTLLTGCSKHVFEEQCKELNFSPKKDNEESYELALTRVLKWSYEKSFGEYMIYIAKCSDRGIICFDNFIIKKI